MKLLYATKNNSKIDNMKQRLKGMPIELLTPKDIDIKVDVEEDGKTPSENALKKASIYFKKTKIPTIAGDSGLYISRLPKDKQPGLFVRRVNGKELSDDEMIEYYSNLVHNLGGESEAYYITGLAIVTEYGSYTVDIEEDNFILTEKIDKEHNHRGNPLDSITIDPSCKKYYSEMDTDDFKNLGYKFEKECIKFIQTNLIDTIYKASAEEIEKNRPFPLNKFDQVFMKQESMILQAKTFYHYLANKKVVFLGDGDGAEMMYGLLLAAGLEDGVENLTILDFDQRILNYHKKLYEKHELSKFYDQNLVNYNVIDPIPEHLSKKFDMFYINPPYGSQNRGSSCIAWLERCIDLCKENCTGCIIIPCSDEFPWSLEAMSKIQEYLIQNGFVIKELVQDIHSYFMDKNLKSSTIIVEKIGKSRNEYTGKKLPKKLTRNLYGKEINIPKFILDDKTDYGQEKY